MKKLTLKAFKDLTKDMPDDTIICVPYAHEASSLMCTVNFVHLSPVEHSYGDENTITIGLDLDRKKETIDGQMELRVSKLVDKNTWDRIDYKESE